MFGLNIFKFCSIFSVHGINLSHRTTLKTDEKGVKTEQGGFSEVVGG